MNCPNCNNLMGEFYDEELDLLFLDGKINDQYKVFECTKCDFGLISSWDNKTIVGQSLGWNSFYRELIAEMYYKYYYLPIETPYHPFCR